MPPLDLMRAFLAATAVFAYMPGPAMLYTAAQTLARGRRHALQDSTQPAGRGGLGADGAAAPPHFAGTVCTAAN